MAAASTRRTQAERRSATRAALLDATVQSVVERGVAGTTTPEVCRRAGVAQGSLFKHFATKDELMASVAEHLYDGLTTSWLERFALLPDGDDEQRVRAGVLLLWALYQSPEHGAALDLLAAARTDAGLQAALQPVVARHAERLRAVAAEQFPELVADPGAAVTLDLLLEAMLGMALSRCVDRSTEHFDRLLDHLTELPRQRLRAAI